MSPPPWDGVLIFAFSRSGRDEERIPAMTYELTLHVRTKNVEITRSRAARGTSRFPSLKTRVPPPVGRGRVLHINFFSANSLLKYTPDTFDEVSRKWYDWYDD